MLAGAHFASGVLLRDALKREPKFLRWLILIPGLFLFHWLLDSTSSTHFLGKLTLWQQALLIGWNFLWIGFLCYRCRRRKHWGYILAGLLGWLIWDIEWLFVPGGGYGFIHQLKRLTTIGGELPFPRGAILEFCWMAVVTIIALPSLKGKRRKSK